MYASVGSEIPGEGWTFEPKYDGIRVLAYATAAEVKLMTRNGKDKSAQFPEIVAALKKLAAQTKRSLVLDGEIVALRDGEPARFQELQSRMHVKEMHAIERYSSSTPAALILFDILADGEDDILIGEPWSERRARLVKRVGKRVSAQLRVTESMEGDGKKMLNEARRQGWEGIIAKRTDSRYEPGNRSRNWLKLKIEFRQEFVVGGFTDPRNSRAHIGALLLGYFDKDRFIYVGHTGGGFTQKGGNSTYKSQLIWSGYSEEADRIQELVAAGHMEEAARVVPDQYIDDRFLIGPIDRIEERARLWRDAGPTGLIVRSEYLDVFGPIKRALDG